jgi:AraC-like DNA-binding protein
MYCDNMQLTEDLNENTVHGSRLFPIQYYVDELFRLRNMRVPMHWHSELEFFVAHGGEVQIQVQNCLITLQNGEGIFINNCMLHGFQQSDKADLCQCPNIVFSKEMIGASVGAIDQKYISPILLNEHIPYFIMTDRNIWHRDILDRLDSVFSLLQRYGKAGAYDPVPILSYKHRDITSPCFEMNVQNLLSDIWQIIYANRDEIPEVKTEKKNLIPLIRMQKMLTFIQDNYMQLISLDQIAASADIAKSEASRCFQMYMKESPVNYLINFRIERAKHMLDEPIKNISQISAECGFQSVSYFVKLFHKETGLTPMQYRESRFSAE